MVASSSGNYNNSGIKEDRKVYKLQVQAERLVDPLSVFYFLASFTRDSLCIRILQRTEPIDICIYVCIIIYAYKYRNRGRGGQDRQQQRQRDREIKKDKIEVGKSQGPQCELTGWRPRRVNMYFQNESKDLKNRIISAVVLI